MKQRGQRGLRRLLLALLLLCCGAASADVFQPAYLELHQLTTDRYQVTWKVPAIGHQRLDADVQLPPGTLQSGPRRMQATGSALIEQWQIQRPGGLSGQRVAITGIASGITDVLVRVERQDGTVQLERLPPEATSFIVKDSESLGAVATTYLRLGVEHILGGIDHLLFVLALLLIVQTPRRLLATITAFTAAHSITLVAATLGWIHVPGPPVEAMIALSIVFVAAEIVHGQRGNPGLTARAPWVVAFCFGLLHGLGFAGALADIGLPPQAVPIALLFFNLGVEVGQLLFVASVMILIALFKRMGRQLHHRPPVWSALLAPYTIGATAMFWMLQRLQAFV